MARMLIGVLMLFAFGGSGGQSGAGAVPAERIAAQALAKLEPYHLVHLDTAAIAAAVRAGAPVRLPFVSVGSRLTWVDVRLRARNLRGSGLTVADVKNGVGKTYRTLPLPPPATYQGRAQGREPDQSGAAIFTITPRVVEGNVLLSPENEGWSIIEPLEPQLRLHGVDAQQRATVLKQFNHIVYNAKDQHQRFQVDADLYPHPAAAKGAPVPPTQLVVPTVADGDEAFYRAYPPDSVMPFWLKEETLFNTLDWLFNCIEPAANSANPYTRCENDFDGGHDGFRATVRLDRLEVWEAGGPNSTQRETLLRQSARETHQAAPPCCGPPHTAGRAALVFFFSGRTLTPGAGVASVDGLNIYGSSCFADDQSYLCHHALTQVTPGGEFPGNAFYQELLVAHEVGHLIGGAEQLNPFGVCWLFGKQCGPNLMGSVAFNGGPLYLFTEEDTHGYMGPLMKLRLSGTPPRDK
jgi:hypothetical protein